MRSNKHEPLLIKSAVVVLHDKLADSLILTKRSMNLRTHPGEICFPGGCWEAQDKDLWNTALRELYEELGVEPERVEYIQALSPEKTHSNTIIFPWLASINHIKPYVINEQEVTAVLPLPMREVVCQRNYKDIVVNQYGMKVKSCQFTACDQFVWGATARIMQQLCKNIGSS